MRFLFLATVPSKLTWCAPDPLPSITNPSTLALAPPGLTNSPLPVRHSSQAEPRASAQLRQTSSCASSPVPPKK